MPTLNGFEILGIILGIISIITTLVYFVYLKILECSKVSKHEYKEYLITKRGFTYSTFVRQREDGGVNTVLLKSTSLRRLKQLLDLYPFMDILLKKVLLRSKQKTLFEISLYEIGLEINDSNARPLFRVERNGEYGYHASSTHDLKSEANIFLLSSLGRMIIDGYTYISHTEYHR